MSERNIFIFVFGLCVLYLLINNFIIPETEFAVMMFVLGLYFAVLGLRLWFQKGFDEKLRKEGYTFYSKYDQGAYFFLGGLPFFLLSIYLLFF